MRSPPGWFAAWVLVGAGFVVALTVPNVRLPSDRLGLRRYQVPVQANITVSQTFVMRADGFHAIEFAPVALAAPASGTLRLQLEEAGSGIVRSRDVHAADITRSPSYRFEFEPIQDSKDAAYRFDVLSSDSDPAAGVGLWATKGERSSGTMLVNDRERWADLAYATFAPAGRSSWRRLLDASTSGRSRGPVLFSLLVAYWAALGFVLRSLAGRPQPQPPISAAEAAPSG